MVSSSSNVSADQEVTKMVVVMVVAFSVCWFPYAVVSMTNVFLKKVIDLHVDNFRVSCSNCYIQKIYWLGAIPAFFAKSAAVYNPLIYIGLNRQVKIC